MAKTLKAVRVEEELWTQAMAKAVAEGVALSEVIREALKNYVEKS